jgi:hypothetical protein
MEISNLPQKSAKSWVGAEPLFGDVSGVWNRCMGMRLLHLSNTVAAFGGLIEGIGISKTYVCPKIP